jgi:hypothetical protein
MGVHPALPTVALRPLMPLTAGTSKPLLTYRIEFVHDLPEYPASDPYGYTYVVPSRGRSSQEIKASFEEVTILI